MPQSRFLQIILFSAAINNHYLDFVQTRGLISLVNDNHVDNNLKEILVHAYFGSTVNNRSKGESNEEEEKKKKKKKKKHAAKQTQFGCW